MKHLLIIAVAVFLTGCAVQYTEWPEIDEAESEYAVVVGYFVSGTYLPEDPVCNTEQPDGTFIWCMDPPPMALRFNVYDSVFGSQVPSRVVTFTSSHYGKSGIDFGSEHPYMLLLVSSGDEFITPRYHMKRLAYDSRNKLSVPLSSPSDSIFWLPCGVILPAKNMRFVSPKKVFKIDVDHLSDSELRERQDFVSVRGTAATIKRGVHIDEIRRRLKGANKADIDDGCKM